MAVHAIAGRTSGGGGCTRAQTRCSVGRLTRCDIGANSHTSFSNHALLTRVRLQAPCAATPSPTYHVSACILTYLRGLDG